MNAAFKAGRGDRIAWLVLPSLQALLLCLLPRPANLPEWAIMGSFLLVTGFSSRQLFADPQPYSLNKIWWLFGAAFLGIAPSVQAALHRTPWRDGDIAPGTVLYANAVVLGALILYSLARYLLQKKYRPAEIRAVRVHDAYVSRFRVAAPLIVAGSGLALLYAYGLKGLFLRGYFEAASRHFDPTFQLAFDKGLRGLMLYCAIAAIRLRRERKVSAWFCRLLLCLVFVFNFPLALPRSLAFTMYISWLIAAGVPLVRKRYAFITLMLSLLLLAAPLADVTRYAGAGMMRRLADPAALFRKAYLLSDYDAYSSLCRTIQLVDSSGSTHGRQAAGVLLFFVPRRAWPEKPVGSGAYLFTRLGFDFKNVSCTYLAEGYINAGLPGTLLFTLLMAAVLTVYDSWYRRNSTAFAYRTFFYPVFTGMMLFILRGDLLSSCAYTCGLLVSGWLLHRLLSFRPKL